MELIKLYQHQAKNVNIKVGDKFFKARVNKIDPIKNGIRATLLDSKMDTFIEAHQIKEVESLDV